jgi:prepilin-type N-terminal cleavage/methylation domain-containing protein
MAKLLRKLTPKNSAGFTLIELLIVVVIIVIVIGVGAASYSTVARNARNSERTSELAKIALALEDYYADHGKYPDTDYRFQTANAFPNNPLNCILGGSHAQSVTPAGVCTEPYNIYIADGDKAQFPIDPLYDDYRNPESNYSYCSDMDGQKYALVAHKYEGNAPDQNSFNAGDPFWDKAIDWNPDVNLWNNKYVLYSPRR